ncbi:MAG: NAD(P)H-hydrate dehydratase [Eubacterium sp.]
MLVLTADEIRTVEKKCFELYSTEAELMLRAGTACFERIINKYQLKGKSVSVLCGNGKNAGDGFVIARLLNSYGAEAAIVLCDRNPTIDEPLMYFGQAVSSGVKAERFTKQCLNADFVIDTMFGIGFHGVPRAPFDKIFEALDYYNGVCISIDTPSGTNSTTGEICNHCVKADFTIAISTLKYCHILPPANEYCGEIELVDIGIPADCYQGNYVKTIDFDMVKSLMPKRSKNANKGSFGHQLNICGSYKMFGAAVIAAKAALRSGVGLVKLAVPDIAYPLVAAHLTQPVFNPLPSSGDTFSKSAVDDICSELNWADSVVIGCGLGVNDDTNAVVEAVIKNAKCPIIVDADGINCINSSISILKGIKVPVVLTPHPGEMARLISKTPAEVQADRINIAKNFAREYKSIVVLKGANTVVTDGDKVFVCLTGNPAMAMGGTGDMLSGIIGAFVAQGIDAFDAAVAGVYIHGLCGDLAAQKLSSRGIVVDDMIEQMGALMSDFE